MVGTTNGEQSSLRAQASVFVPGQVQCGFEFQPQPTQMKVGAAEFVPGQTWAGEQQTLFQQQNDWMMQQQFMMSDQFMQPMEYQQNMPRNQKGRQEKSCFKCHAKDHLARECPLTDAIKRGETGQSLGIQPQKGMPNMPVMLPMNAMMVPQMPMMQNGMMMQPMMVQAVQNNFRPQMQSQIAPILAEKEEEKPKPEEEAPKEETTKDESACSERKEEEVVAPRTETVAGSPTPARSEDSKEAEPEKPEEPAKSSAPSWADRIKNPVVKKAPEPKVSQPYKPPVPKAVVAAPEVAEKKAPASLPQVTMADGKKEKKGKGGGKDKGQERREKSEKGKTEKGKGKGKDKKEKVIEKVKAPEKPVSEKTPVKDEGPKVPTWADRFKAPKPAPVPAAPKAMPKPVEKPAEKPEPKAEPKPEEVEEKPVEEPVEEIKVEEPVVEVKAEEPVKVEEPQEKEEKVEAPKEEVKPKEEEKKEEEVEDKPKQMSWADRMKKAPSSKPAVKPVPKVEAKKVEKKVEIVVKEQPKVEEEKEVVEPKEEEKVEESKEEKVEQPKEEKIEEPKPDEKIEEPKAEETIEEPKAEEKIEEPKEEEEKVEEPKEEIVEEPKEEEVEQPKEEIVEEPKEEEKVEEPKEEEIVEEPKEEEKAEPTEEKKAEEVVEEKVEEEPKIEEKPKLSPFFTQKKKGAARKAPNLKMMQAKNAEKAAEKEIQEARRPSGGITIVGRITDDTPILNNPEPICPEPLPEAKECKPTLETQSTKDETPREDLPTSSDCDTFDCQMSRPSTPSYNEITSPLPPLEDNPECIYDREYLVQIRTALDLPFRKSIPPPAEFLRRTTSGRRRGKNWGDDDKNWREEKPALQSSESSWQAQQRGNKKEADRDLMMDRKVNGLLNKITADTFEKLSKELLTVGMNTVRDIHACVQMIFSKATTQHNFIHMYTSLCLKIHKWTKVAKFEQQLDFRRILLNECQNSFESNLELPENLNPTSESLLKGDEYVEERLKWKEKMIGNIKFVGNLINAKLIAAKIMFSIIDELIKENTDETLETLAAFFTEIGPQWDIPETDHGKILDERFQQMQQMLTDDKIPSTRVVCLLRDVFDLRECKWKRSNLRQSTTAPAPKQRATIQRTSTQPITTDDDGFQSVTTGRSSRRGQVQKSESMPSYSRSNSAFSMLSQQEPEKEKAAMEPKPVQTSSSAPKGPIDQVGHRILQQFDKGGDIESIEEEFGDLDTTEADAHSLMKLIVATCELRNTEPAFQVLAAVTKEQKFCSEMMSEAMLEFAEIAEDLICDIPKLGQIVKDQIVPAFEDLLSDEANEALKAI